jgi:hypothetical protein
MERFSIGGVIYIILGVLIAMSHGYIVNVGAISLSQLVSFLLAVALWPLVLLGVNFHLAL